MLNWTQPETHFLYLEHNPITLTVWIQVKRWPGRAWWGSERRVITPTTTLTLLLTKTQNLDWEPLRNLFLTSHTGHTLNLWFWRKRPSGRVWWAPWTQGQPLSRAAVGSAARCAAAAAHALAGPEGYRRGKWKRGAFELASWKRKYFNPYFDVPE